MRRLLHVVGAMVVVCLIEAVGVVEADGAGAAGAPSAAGAAGAAVAPSAAGAAGAAIKGNATKAAVPPGQDHDCIVGRPPSTIDWTALRNPILSYPANGVKDQALQWSGGSGTCSSAT